MKSKKFLFLFFLLFVNMFVFSQHTKIHSKKNKELSDEEKLKNTSIFINANKEKILGNFYQAIELFQKCIKKDPSSAASYYEIARILVNQNKLNDAIIYAKKAVEINNKNIWYKILLAEIYKSTKQYLLSIDVYKDLVKTNPQNLEIKNDLATLYLYAGKYSDAIEVYNQIESSMGITEEISMQKEKIYVSMNKYNKAREEIEKLIKAFPNEIPNYVRLADLYMIQDMPAKAFETYEKIKKIDSTNGDVHIYLAEYYRSVGNKEKSFEELKLAFANPSIEVNSKVTIILSYLNLIQSFPELKTQAYTLTNILINTHPDNPIAYSIMGDLFYKDKKLDSALTMFEKVIELDSTRYPVWEQTLLICSDLNYYSKILQYTSKALELFPDQPLVYLFNGIANSQLSNYNDAIGSLNKGVDLVVDNKALKSQFYSYLGDVYYKKNDFVKSDQSYDMALKYDSRSTYVLNNYSYYLALRGDSLNKALKMAELAVNITPNSASYLDTYGWVLYKLQRYDEAKINIAKAVELSKSLNATILEHFGDVLFKIGATTDAIDCWEKAFKLGKGSTNLEKKVKDKQLYE